ncbi:CRISPR-associated endonuclease Cas1 [uncultured Methanobrevibacter sp.]|uniref:CRISPR-associated endonuclease Cas1 n=1 Tax=uncultured Methanobrevibacter sp. TaxID=253161 RepID=UPI0025F1FAA0|nr:CRISPR-associated endonuclease Cas1 [uncultured Methanobrevibacter sp.]
MKLFVEGFGKSVARRDNQILIKENDKITNYYVIDDIEQLIITGKGSITFDAMSLLAARNIDTIVLNWKGEVVYQLLPTENKHVNVKKEQYSALNDFRSGYLAKSFIKAKMENQKAVLGTLSKPRENPEFLIQKRDNIANIIIQLNDIRNRPVDDIRNNILGLEGIAANEYWDGIKTIIPNEFNFQSRSGRGAKDPINSMLNYGYAILQTQIIKALFITGLDIYCGYLHGDRYGRASLVFDLIEEFRQQIVDKVVIKMITKRQVKVDDFELKDNIVIISEDKRKLLISEIMKKLKSNVKINNENISYEDIIFYQAKLISKFLLKKEKYNGFSLRW